MNRTSLLIIILIVVVIAITSLSIIRYFQVEEKLNNIDLQAYGLTQKVSHKSGLEMAFCKEIFSDTVSPEELKNHCIRFITENTPTSNSVPFTVYQ